MKLFFTLNFCLMVSFVSNTYSQRLTYNDLVFALTHTIGESEDYLLTKGLTFSYTKDLSESKPAPVTHCYNKNENNDNYLDLSIDEYNGMIYETSIGTYKKEEYQQLRTLIKSLGFKLLSSNGQFTYYEKGNYEITFGVGGEGEKKCYNIELADKTKLQLVLKDTK